MNYPDSVRYLYSLGNEVKSAKFGLETISALMEALGNPQRACRFVHVAGTNGKGSTSAMIESGLRTAGVRTGLYTSPHLSEPTERIQVAGREITANEFAQAFDTVHAAAEQLLRDEAIEYHPTYFETVTAMALVLFKRLAADVVVLETGLGGRLDATNIVTPALSVITRVDLDHETYLGRSIEAITSEKAGIIKAGIPAVFAAQKPEAETVLQKRAVTTGSAVFRSADWIVDDAEFDPQGSRFTMRKEGERELRIRCPLAGEHQVENAVAAAVALVRLGVPSAAIEQGIAAASWPGRLERVSVRPDIILDGAHNPSGARALASYIQRFYADRKITLIYGAMRDKAVAEIAGILFPAARTVIATAPSQERATRPETIRDLSGRETLISHNVAEALQIAAAAGPDEAVFVTGSLFVVGEARRIVRSAERLL